MKTLQTILPLFLAGLWIVITPHRVDNKASVEDTLRDSSLQIEPPFLKETRVQEFLRLYEERRLRVNDRSRDFYYPQAVKMFEEAGFSPELARLYAELPTVESTWEPSAKSSTGALGFWQQIGSTAKSYGLRHTNGLDDRMDFMKSTDAAVRHIKALHAMFQGDPIKVLFAYNGGESVVLKKMQEHKTDNGFSLNFNSNETFDFAPKVVGAYLYYRRDREIYNW